MEAVAFPADALGPSSTTPSSPSVDTKPAPWPVTPANGTPSSPTPHQLRSAAAAPPTHARGPGPSPSPTLLRRFRRRFARLVCCSVDPQAFGHEDDHVAPGGVDTDVAAGGGKGARRWGGRRLQLSMHAPGEQRHAGSSDGADGADAVGRRLTNGYHAAPSCGSGPARGSGASRHSCASSGSEFFDALSCVSCWSTPPPHAQALGAQEDGADGATAGHHHSYHRAGPKSEQALGLVDGGPAAAAAGDGQLVAAVKGYCALPPPAPGLPVELRVALPPWVPHQQLMFIDPSTRFVPIPKNVGINGYWAKVTERSTPNPLPIDDLVRPIFIVKKAHESIAGMKVVETPDTITIKIRVHVWGVTHAYTEVYNKDGSVSFSALRRDARPGKGAHRVYYTDKGDMVFVTDSIGLLGHVDFHGEEFVRTSVAKAALGNGDGGGDDTIHFRMYCHSHLNGKSAEQFFTGRKAELPAAKH